MKSVINDIITLLEESQRSIQENNIQEVQDHLNHAYDLLVSLFQEKIEARILLDRMIEICQSNPAMDEITNNYLKKREELNQNRTDLYNGDDNDMWEELDDVEATDLYDQKSILEITKRAANYWKDHQDSRAKEYYLRAKRLTGIANFDHVMVFFKPNNFLEYIYVQERDYSGLKKYYLWALELLQYVVNSASIEITVRIYIKLAMLSQNIEEKNQQYRLALQYMIIKHCEDGAFEWAFDIGNIVDMNYMKEVIRYYLMLIGENSEKCFDEIISLSDLYLSKYESEWLFEEALDWIKRTKDISKLQEVIDAFVPKDNNTKKHYDQKILQSAEACYKEDSLELANLRYQIAQAAIKYNRNHDKSTSANYDILSFYEPLLEEALRVYEIYYPVGSKELYDKYRKTIQAFLLCANEFYFSEIVKMYRDKLLKKNTDYCTKEAEAFCKKMDSLGQEHFGHSLNLKLGN